MLLVQVIGTLSAHKDSVECVEFSPRFVNLFFFFFLKKVVIVMLCSCLKPIKCSNS